MELPLELIFHIFSHISLEDTSLQGLQVAYTCRAAYRQYQPLVIERHVNLILGAVDSKNLRGDNEQEFMNGVKTIFQHDPLLRLPDSAPVQMEKPLLYFSSLRFCLSSRLDPTAIWSLSSLLARARRLQVPVRNFQLDVSGFSATNWVREHQYRRRLLKLFEELAQHQETALKLVGGELPNTDPSTGGTNGNWNPSLGFQAALPSLSLRGSTFEPFRQMDLGTLIQLSSNTITSLHLESILTQRQTPQEWVAAFSSWNIGRLSELELRDMVLPLVEILAFLERHAASLTRATMLHASSGPSIQGRAYASMLETLVCRGEILDLMLASGVTFPHLHFVFLDDVTHRDLVFSTPIPTIQLTSILVGLQNQAPALQMLRLNLVYTRELRGWLASAKVAPPKVASKALAAVRDLVSHGFSGRQNAIRSKPKGSALALALGSLTRVTTLYLSIQGVSRTGATGSWAPPPSEHIPPHLIVDFVAAFPSLQTAYISRAFSQLPPGVRDGGQKFWAELKKVWVKAGSLEELYLRGVGLSEERTMWIRGKEEPTPGFEAYEHAFRSRHRVFSNHML